MSHTICLLGAFDTKGPEYEFVLGYLREEGFGTFLVDVGVLGKSSLTPDVSSSEVCRAGGGDFEALRRNEDRGEAVAAMSRGIARLLPELHKKGKFDGVIALGGTGGTSVACAGMRELPLGVPKVMVSTVAGTDVSAYVGVSDILMFPSIVDVAGINEISREVFARAAATVGAMVSAKIPEGISKPLIGATMFGNTTKAVGIAREILEKEGYEVLVFHCTGNGGRTMEALAAAGKLAGVLDLTTTEWADEHVGGVFRAGPDRLSAAALNGIPAIVTPGCLDMVNFWAPETVPEKFQGRTFYPHNPNVTLMRTTTEECRAIAAIFAEKLNASKAPITVLLPARGWSVIDSPGGPFWLPEANTAFHEKLKAGLNSGIKVLEMDNNINDEEFAAACARELLANIKSTKET
ncbi:MAG: Tm-1-like ATP-binding domain-containing protein [Candidatus Sumerlaeia bacterium]|nr:Tm-1-like ATP-binding domain-containing protein [Candidatus Sumerlaeia bacterium]